MTSFRSCPLFLIAAVVLVACGRGSPSSDAGSDAGVDASTDAGETDAGLPDAGEPDAGLSDAGEPDAGSPDAGEPDAGSPDAGGPDAGEPDAGVPDAGQIPNTILTATPPALTASTEATFRFSSTEPGSTFECNLDSAGFTSCASPATYMALSDGPHGFAVRATSPGGLADPTPATWTWTVDATPPNTLITSGPGDLVSTTSATFSFDSTESGFFQCALDGSSFASCPSPVSVVRLSEGPHTFQVRAVDLALNADPSPASRTWTVDTTPPDTTLTSAPSGTVASASATLTFTSSEPGTFECSLDGSGFAACTSPATYPGLTDGPHTFSVRAVDAALHTDSTPSTASWRVDTTPPDTQITSGPSGTVASTTATFTFTSTESGSTFECSLDGAAFAPCTSPRTYSGLTSATHGFSVRAIDAVLNTDPTPASSTWTIASSTTVVRIMAGNLTSGTNQSYDPGEGIRIFQGLRPDIALIQEFHYGANTPADIRTFVDTAFGPAFYYFREPVVSAGDLPNGIVSRYPILTSGEWHDNFVGNRDYAWARIDVPGPVDLWAVSVHLKASSSSAGTRNSEATELVSYINANVPASSYLVIGGDFNTYSRGEACVTTLSQVVITAAPYPADQNGNSNTNAGRASPYDWVIADPDLDPLRDTTAIGASTYPSGLVFDSRVYTPLSEVTPVLLGDSGATGMQHMGVVRDFRIPN